MEYRPLGRTGVQVSNAVPRHDDVRRLGQPRPRRLDPHHPPRARRRDQLRRHRRRATRPASPRRSSARRSRAAATTSCWPPSSSCRWATDPNQRGGSRRWIIRAVEDSLRRLGTDWIDLYQVHRPDPRHRRRGDARRADRPRPAGQGPLHRLARRSPRQPDRRGAVDRARARPAALPHRAAAVLAAGARHRASTSCRPRSATAWASSPTARSPAAGCPGRWSADSSPTSPRPPAAGRSASTCRCPRTSASSRPSSSSPSVADDAGLPMIELAIALRRSTTRRSPRRSSGRARWSSSTASCPPPTSALDAAMLDRIDEIVAPGVNLNPPTRATATRSSTPALRRR